MLCNFSTYISVPVITKRSSHKFLLMELSFMIKSGLYSSPLS